MNQYTVPHDEDSVTDRWRYRQEWERWLAELDFNRFVTLNFNRDTTPAENCNAIKACNVHTFPYIPSSLPDFSLPQPFSATFHELIVYRTHIVMV